MYLTSVRSQLPAVEDFPAYLASHQTAATQLAIAYCSALMNDSTKWPGFFGAGATSAGYFPGNGWDNLVNPIVDRFLSSNTLYNSGHSSSVATVMHDELISLLTHVDSLSDNPRRKAGLCVGGSCGTNAEILNAATVTCAAALANAALTMQ